MKQKIKSLKSNKEFMKYLSNTSYLFFDKIFRMGIGFFVIIYLTRYLGPERFGLLSYAQSFVSIFVAFASLGLSQIIVREIVNNKEKIDEILGTVTVMMFVSSMISMSSIFAISFFIYDDYESKLLVNIISMTIIFQAFYIIIESFFQAKVLSKYIVYSSNVSFVISSSIKILLIYFEMPLIYFAYALVFDSFILALACFFIYQYQNTSIFTWKFEKELAKKYIKASIPLVLVSITAFIYTRIDQIMLKHILGDEAVGNYAAAVRVSELFYFIPGIIAASVYPKLIEAKAQNEKKYLNLLENLYRLVLWISILVALIMSFGSNIIVDILYGEQFKDAAKILRILSWCMIFASLSAVFVKILYIEHWENKYMYKNFFGVFLNTVLNYLLINIYGVTGAALATFITLFSVNYIFDLFDKSLRQYYYIKIYCWLPKKKGLL